jgi:hypothetical protein
MTLRTLGFSLYFCLFSGLAGAGAPEAAAILRQNCLKCHGAPDGPNYAGFDSAGDLNRLRQSRFVDLRNPAASAIYQAVLNDRMPLGGGARLTAAEKAQLLAWIQSGAPGLPAGANVPAKTLPIATAPSSATAPLVANTVASLAPPAAARPTPPKFAPFNDPVVERNYLVNVIQADLAKWRAGETFLYFIASGRTPDLERRALIKALNSLNQKPTIVIPRTIDARELVYRVNTNELSWGNGAYETLSQLAQVKIPLNPASSPNEISQAVFAFSLTSLLRDFMKNDIYLSLLDVPGTAAELEASLGVNVERNILGGIALRGGFRSSEVALHNRVIEHHPTKFGAYWKSYDFADPTAEGGNIFTHPVGPLLSSQPNAPGVFLQSGGEIIWNLPNGFQAYVLVNAVGNVIREAPLEIVHDTTRGDEPVRNPLSCMGCHANGMRVNQDVLHDAITARRDVSDPRIIQRALALYRGNPELQQVLQRDSSTYQNALRKAGLPTPVLPDEEPLTQYLR